jgi:hypothetical protein
VGGELNSRSKKFLVGLAWGFIYGGVYYLIFALAVPYLIESLIPSGQEVALNLRPGVLAYLALFTALGIIEYTFSDVPAVAPLKVLDKIIAVIILFHILNWGYIEGSMSMNGSIVDISLNIRFLLYTVALFSLLYGLFDSLRFLEKTRQ